LFGAGRVADTLSGRLELMMLHGCLAMVRLRREPALAPLAQAFADRLFSQFDAGLREAGVGDLAVPKKMRVIAADFYGRLTSYAGALAAQDERLLETALGRNVLGAAAAPFAPALAAYVAAVAAHQAAAPAATMLGPEGWPPALP
jgi:cytochrome b pre-mRNA-processing protein 3